MNETPHNPHTFPTKSVTSDETGVTRSFTFGMTLRDYFAARAMQSLISFHGSYSFNDGSDALSKQAYKIADSMLKASQS